MANRCRSLRRSRWSRLIRQAEPAVTSELAPDVELDLDLRRALNRLGYEDRLALVLRFYLDLTYDEVAAVIGVSQQAARSRTQRAVRRLRLHMTEPKELT